MKLGEVAKTGFEAYRMHRSLRGERRSYGQLGQQRTRNQDIVYRITRQSLK